MKHKRSFIEDNKQTLFLKLKDQSLHFRGFKRIYFIKKSNPRVSNQLWELPSAELYYRVNLM